MEDTKLSIKSNPDDDFEIFLEYYKEEDLTSIKFTQTDLVFKQASQINIQIKNKGEKTSTIKIKIVSQNLKSKKSFFKKFNFVEYLLFFLLLIFLIIGVIVYYCVNFKSKKLSISFRGLQNLSKDSQSRVIEMYFNSQISVHKDDVIGDDTIDEIISDKTDY